jgi:hypothetical protein
VDRDDLTVAVFPITLAGAGRPPMPIEHAPPSLGGKSSQPIRPLSRTSGSVLYSSRNHRRGVDGPLRIKEEP